MNMQTTIANLAEAFAPYQPSLVVFVSICSFLLMFVVTYSVGRLFRSRDAIRRRALDTKTLSGADVENRRNIRNQRFASTGKLLSSVANNLIPSDKKSVSAVRNDLVEAGYFQASAVATYYTLRVALAALLPATAFLTVKMFTFDVAGMELLGLLIVTAAIGLLAPRYYVGRRRKKLQQQCRDGFPDFMDLMVVCAEAGVSMDAAIARISQELTPPYPHLGTSLHLAGLELRAGKSLADTFENLAERLGIQEAHNLGALLKQSAELGTSLSDALRVYSEEMRDKRMSRAEEKAFALPAKISVPMTLFVFPVVLVVILTPVFIRISGLM